MAKQVSRRPSRYLEVGPVLEWLEDEVLPRYESWNHLAEILAARSDLKPESWQRSLIRLKNKSHIDVFALDRLCCLLNEHVSRFQP